MRSWANRRLGPCRWPATKPRQTRPRPHHSLSANDKECALPRLRAAGRNSKKAANGSGLPGYRAAEDSVLRRNSRWEGRSARPFVEPDSGREQKESREAPAKPPGWPARGKENSENRDQ